MAHPPRPDFTMAAHAQWALSLWLPTDGREAPARGHLVDWAVTGLGLAGEALETLEAASADALDLEHLRKELGDTLYYWGIACLRAGLDPDEEWPIEIPFDLVEEGAPDQRLVERAATRLAVSAGRCSEAIKKIIRDEAELARLRAALPEMGQRIAELCLASRMSAMDVAAANRAKLLDRQSRGALRGDGNER